MDSATRPPYRPGQSNWQRFSQAAVRAFHRYATWLVSLTWTRFVIYSIVLIAAAGIVSEMPPFSWHYTETTTVDRHHRTHVPPPVPPMPASHPMTPGLPVMPPSASMPALPAPPAKAASESDTPTIHITRTPDTNSDGPQKSVNIRLPGIVIDTRADKGSDSRPGSVNISIGPNGIHIEGVDKERDKSADEARAASQAAAAAAATAASANEAAHHATAHGASQAQAAAAAAKARAEAIKADATRAKSGAASAAGAGPEAALGASPATNPAGQRVVELDVDGHHVRIVVPSDTTDEAVKEAIESARDQIVEQLKDAAEQAREAADEARSAAEEQRQAREDAMPSADSVEDDNDGDGPTTRTHTVRYGESLPLLAFWWVVFSLITKLAYKGRLQAETKAAVMAETAEAESLRRQVIEARMAMMQAQVEPHFLFNTLASIDHLIEVDPKRASRMQRNLIALLRASMPTMREASDGGTRPLEREMAVIRPYLEILQVRMEERLTTAVDVPDGLNSAEFPPMMIQTLVENAIKHGLEPKPEGGHLSVKAEIRHGKLVVTVADTGLGFSKAEQGSTATSGTGVGLANIRERLAMLYGTRAALTVSDNPGGGTIATITVPYTTRSAEEGATA